MIEPVFEKGYPSYEAVNRNTNMNDDEMVIWLHEIARTVEGYGAANLDAKTLRNVADRFSELAKQQKENYGIPKD